MSTSQLGALFVNADTSNLVEVMEDTGFDTLFCAEGQGMSAFSRLNHYATITNSLRLATGIVNIFSRSPSVIAQEIASLDYFSEGRAMLGLGVAHPGVSEEFHGIPFNRPVTRLQEYVTLIRKYLRGEAEAYEGEFFSPGRTSFWEFFEPIRSDIPIYNGAVGEQNIKKTGECFDGWLPVFYPFHRIQQAKSWLEEGADRAGRSVEDINTSLVVITVVGEDSDEIRRIASLQVATYLRDVPGFYDRVAREGGFDDSVNAVLNAGSTHDAADVMGNELIDALSVVGDPSSVTDRLRELGKEHDLDRLVVFVPGVTDSETRLRTVQSVGRAFN